MFNNCIISFGAPKFMKDRLDKLKEMFECSRSDIIRIAITEFYARECLRKEADND